MYNSRKKQMEEIPEEITAIWSCSNEDCNGWMRRNFAFVNHPTCPQCGSTMVEDERMLAVLTNTSFNSHSQLSE
ncbi:MAG TPA: cold-shock protein [Paenibacillus sp.]|jgi:aspartate carbamoyltransferase regulatory subunit